MSRISRLLLVAFLACPSLLAQGLSGVDLLVVPTGDVRERVEGLVHAGHVQGWTDSFVVGEATPALRADVLAKGLPHVVVTPPAGKDLYVMHVSSCEEVARIETLLDVLYATPTDLLVAASTTQRDAYLALPKTIHGPLSILTRDPLIVSPERAFDSLGARSALDGLTPNPEIQALVAQVSAGNLHSTVNLLSAIHTRRSDQPGGTQAQQQIVSWFQAIPGLQVSTHDFDANADNVVAILPGVSDPSRIVVVGAHYDSIVSGAASSRAPGADDNASGTAAVLEIARIFAGQPFRYTIHFVCFASEEFGLVGSTAYAQRLVNQGADVIAMVNTDMNAYRRPGDPFDVHFITNDSSPALNAFGAEVALAYVPHLATHESSLSAGTSDHRPFQQRGIPASFPFEDIPNYSPYIHTVNDDLTNSANDFQLSQAITQLVLGMVAEIAAPASLEVTHVPLASTADTQGPYRVVAQASSRVGSAIANVTIEGEDANGPFSFPMVPSGTPDTWIGDLPGQPTGTTLRYAITAQDAQGRFARSPQPGLSSGFHTFFVGSRAQLFATDFESGAAGFTHGMVATQDDWQLGTPRGASGDPSSAASGLACWGNDLGPSGWNGAYQNNVDNWLRSPSIDCSGESGVHLSFQRWLTVEDGFYDQATVLVNGQPVWENPATPGGGTNHLIDTAWVPMDLDISAIADGNPNVEVTFRLRTDGGMAFGGWNVDDFQVTASRPSVTRSLVADRTFSSLSAGTPIAFDLDLGTPHAGELYLVAVSGSGSSPGTPFGSVVVPLNFDLFTQFALENLAVTSVFANFVGNLDANGRAQATFALPPGTEPLLVGTELTFAALTVTGAMAVTTPVDVLLVE